MKNDNRSAVFSQSEKIAIISDTHDNLANIKKAIHILERDGVKTILHCGDIAAQETIKEIVKEFKGKIYVVFGNMDNDRLSLKEIESQYPKRLKIWEESGKLNIKGKKIAFNHFPEIAKNLANSGEYDLVFYGHTHKPWEEKIGKTRLVNPGNLAGIFYKATFAVYDTKTNKLELKIV